MASVEGKGRLHFVEEKAETNAKHNIFNSLPKLVEDAYALLENCIVFQQDSAPVHEAMRTQQ